MIEEHGFCPHQVDIRPRCGFIFQNVNLGVLCVYHDGQEPSVAAPVKGQEVQSIGAAAEHALSQSVCRMGFIRHLIGFLCPADKGLNILNALGVGGGDHLGHFDNPMPLHLAVNIVIVNPFQVIGEPFVPDRQQPKEGGLARTLTAHQTEHHLKLAARLEHSANCSHHEQAQTFIGVLAVLCAEIAGEGIADALCAVPFQAVQVITDGVVLVAVRDNGNGFFNLLFAGQSVLVLQIEHEVIEVRVVQGRCGLLPPEGLYNINALRQNVVADSTLQIGVVLKHGQAVPYAVSDSSVIGQVQTSPDFFHGHARLCVLQIAVQDLSPLFFARQPEPSFHRLCRTEEHPADIRCGFLVAGLPRTADAIRPPAAAVRTAVSMFSGDGNSRTAPCSTCFLPAGISVPG